jgi:hypothetical protein
MGRPSQKPLVEYKGFLYQAASWKTARRAVAKVEFHFGELFLRVGFVVTNLTLPSRAVVRFYKKRGTAEQWIKEGKHAVKMTQLSCHRFRSDGMGLRPSVIAYNLGNVCRQLSGGIRNWSLPKRVFAYLEPRRNSPTYNICIIAVVAFLAAMAMSFELALECLNFGAFLGFMGVNLATFRQFYLQRSGEEQRKLIGDGILPIAGFLFCLIILLGLPTPAKIVGGSWLLVGLVYDAVQTRGFRKPPTMVDLSDLE